MPSPSLSTITFANAKSRVAEAAGATATDELTKAGYAVQQALQHWDNFHNWRYKQRMSGALDIQGPITGTIVADGVLATVSYTGLDDANTFSWAIGETSGGVEVPYGTYLASAPAGGSVQLSAIIAAGTYDVTVYQPYLYLGADDVRYIHSIKLVTADRLLLPLMERDFRRLMDVTDTGDVTHYTTFRMGDLSLIRLVPTPSADDEGVVLYYDGHAKPSTDGTAIDIPMPYEFYIISLAKAFYLRDKGDHEKADFHWRVGMSGMSQARAADSRWPDDDEGFFPSHSAGMPVNQNAVWPYLQEW